MICSLRCPTTTISSDAPISRRLSKTSSTSGVLSTSIKALGVSSVRGWSRRAFPAARTTACISPACHADGQYPFGGYTAGSVTGGSCAGSQLIALCILDGVHDESTGRLEYRQGSVIVAGLGRDPNQRLRPAGAQEVPGVPEVDP